MNIVSNWKKVLPFIGIAVLIILIWKVDINKIWMVAVKIDPRYLAVLPVTIAGVFVLQTLKWLLIARKQGVHIGFKGLFGITFISFFYGTITPGKIGNLIKISYLKERTGHSFAECSTSVFIDKLLDLIVVFLFGIAGSYLIIEKVSGIFIGVIIAFGMLAISIFFFHDEARTKRFINRFFGFMITARLQDKFRGPFEAFYRVMPRKRWLAVPFIVTLLTWILIYSQNFLIARALGIELNYFVFVVLLALGTVAALIPISISGLGTREAVLVSIFMLYGVAPEKTIAMSLTGLVVCSYIPSIIGWFFSLREARKTPLANVYGLHGKDRPAVSGKLT